MSNKIFDPNSFYNKDGFYDGIIELKLKLKNLGIELSTQDINKESESDFVIYNDFIPKKLINNNSYLLLFESKLIKPENWDLNSHEKFKKIFTWNDDLIENKKYIKINFSRDLKLITKKGVKSKHLTQISSNIIYRGQHELYSERKKIIEWHEKENFKFEFYGKNWNVYLTGYRYFDFFLKRIKLKKSYKNFKGQIDSKLKSLIKYNFSYCLENYDGQNGYITEKIFDCFKCLTIPIYKGHKNTINHIPKNTFINYDDFKDLRELNYYLINLSYKEILEFQGNIIKYLNTENAKKFSNEYTTNQIIKNLIK